MKPSKSKFLTIEQKKTIRQLLVPELKTRTPEGPYSWTVVRSIREFLKLSLREMAYLAKISEAILIKYEKGLSTTKGTPLVIKRISIFLGIPTVFLCDQAYSRPLSRGLKPFTENQEKIIESVHGEGKTITQTAKDLGISKQAVSQTEIAAKHKLTQAVLESELTYLSECQKQVIESQRQTIVLQQKMISVLVNEQVQEERTKEPVTTEEPPVQAVVSPQENPITQYEPEPNNSDKGDAIPARVALRFWLFENKISERKFSQRIGISQGTMSRYINGKTIPSVIVASKVHKETGGAVAPEMWAA
jgi:transcriptional regulator with XRE-family HTH domain